MINKEVFNWAGLALERMAARGVFLTAGSEKPNTMTMGWGSISVYWGRPVFIAPVRKSRYTFELLEKCGDFTLSVPVEANDFIEQLKLCGSRSGRDCDKYAAAGLELNPSKEIEVPVIKGCGAYFECRTIYTEDIIIEKLPAELQKACYPQGDCHRLYYGQILACYGD